MAAPTMRSSPGLEDIWQLHWSYNARIRQNSPGVFIANVDDAATIANGLTAAAAGRRAGRRGSRWPGRAPGATAVPAAEQPPGGAAAAAAHTPACWIKVSAKSDGTFTVTNSRNGFSKTYPKRR